MANKKFSDLTATTTVAATDLFAVETVAGNSRKITRDNVRASQFSGALVKKAADQAAANYSAGAMVPWTAEEYDTDAYHDNVTNNSRLTVPATGKYIARGCIAISGTTLAASDYIRAAVAKNGTIGGIGLGQTITEISATVTTTTFSVGGAAVDCVAGDYFELWFDTESDSSLTIESDLSWFAIERKT